jgi:DNA ligase-1
VDINDIDKVTIFKPMLANKWEDRKDKITYPLYSQPKLDGIRCIINSSGMWTRTGKPIVSAPHIFNSLQAIFEKDPDCIFDGELYADRYASDFNKIVSLVKKTKPTAEDLEESAEAIEYHIYDLPSYPGKFSFRRNQLAIMAHHDKVFRNTKCKVVDTRLALNESMLMNLYAEYVGLGYEGQMLRVNEVYENKRSNYLLKHKSFIDHEYTIVGVIEGGGNLTGMVGALLFQTPQGDEFTASVNGGWDYLKQLWKDKDTLIGKQATIKYFNITPDGKPRFPKVVTVRDYE